MSIAAKKSRTSRERRLAEYDQITAKLSKQAKQSGLTLAKLEEMNLKFYANSN